MNFAAGAAVDDDAPAVPPAPPGAAARLEDACDPNDLDPKDQVRSRPPELLGESRVTRIPPPPPPTALSPGLRSGEAEGSCWSWLPLLFPSSPSALDLLLPLSFVFFFPSPPEAVAPAAAGCFDLGMALEQMNVASTSMAQADWVRLVILPGNEANNYKKRYCHFLSIVAFTYILYRNYIQITHLLLPTTTVRTVFTSHTYVLYCTYFHNIVATNLAPTRTVETQAARNQSTLSPFRKLSLHFSC